MKNKNKTVDIHDEILKIGNGHFTSCEIENDENEVNVTIYYKFLRQDVTGEGYRCFCGTEPLEIYVKIREWMVNNNRYTLLK